MNNAALAAEKARLLTEMAALVVEREQLAEALAWNLAENAVAQSLPATEPVDPPRHEVTELTVC
jgi:hypothetical protein